MKRYAITLAAMALAATAAAAPVEPDVAAQVARGFFANTLGCKTAATLSLRAEGWQYGGLYLFCSADGGFVLVAADDAARPILAYSTTATINPNSIGHNLGYLLECYDNEVSYAASLGLKRDEQWDRLLGGDRLAPATKSGDEPDSVGPLMTTIWGQLSPYNQECPSNAPTGCVATATTQIMRYWNYPAFGEGSHSYNSNHYGPQQADFAHTRYDWAHMPDRLTQQSSAAERDAVSRLMFHVGVAVNMDYDPMQSGALNGSSTDDDRGTAKGALHRYFHYNSDDLVFHTKGNTSDDDWGDMLVGELSQLRPVLYGGASAAGGHSFVCDGYDSHRYFHFNLGENGDGDGFYALNAISYGAYNFSSQNDAVTGIHPEYGLYLSDSVLAYSRGGGEQTLWLAASDTMAAHWTASTSASWLTLADTAFEKLGGMRVVLEPNTTGAERTATVIFSQGTLTATLSVRQAAYDVEDYCPLTVVMENTHGGGWKDDAHISFESPSGLVYATASHSSSGNQSTVQVNVAPHDVVVRWVAGGMQDRYCNYTIKNQHGETLHTVQNAYYNGDARLLVWPCAHVGIEAAAEDLEMTVSPNPTTDYAVVRVAEQLLAVDIVDATGRQADCHVAIDGQHATIATVELARGIYMIRATTAGGTATAKLIVQ